MISEMLSEMDSLKKSSNKKIQMTTNGKPLQIHRVELKRLYIK